MADDQDKKDEGAEEDEKVSVVTATVKFTVEELATLQQMLRTYQLNGPVDQLAQIIPRFQALKEKIITALNALQGVTVNE